MNEPKVSAPVVEPPTAELGGRTTRSRSSQRMGAAGARLGQLVILLLAVSTLMFFLLRISGDPAITLAGEEATPEQIEAIRAQYGLDEPVLVQYGTFVVRATTLDFGSSVRTGEGALGLVVDRLPATMKLAVLGVMLNMLIAIPLGAWIGAHPDRRAQGAVANLVFVGQGVPGYVVALLLIQLFAVRWQWLSSFGDEGIKSHILPAVSLAAFLVPRLTRVLASNVTEAMGEDYVRTARAFGASPATVVRRHALPNALLGASALIGTQLALLLSGALITEVIFAWPGLGQLMIEAVRQLDFPVVQASVFVVALLVFATNLLTDGLLSIIDPRLRAKR
jgi:peptide/nickel transport system permease protein